jgi:hypothetical protein
LTATTAESGAAVLDPERTAWVVSESASGMIDVARVLNLTMTLIPVAAIVIVLVLFRRARVPQSP